MKKILSLIMVLALCMSLAATVMAADNYVPSIGDKNAPEIDGEAVLVEDGKDLEVVPSDHLVITSVNQAKNNETAIPADAKAELLSVYDQLKDGSMKIPYDKAGKDPSTMEIRDLFDASLICTEENSHAEKLAKGEIDIRMTLDTGVKKGDDVVIMAYVDGQWVSAVSVVNNGDGTVTVVLEELCPIAICVNAKTPPAQTGDAMNDGSLYIWGGVLVACLVAMIVLVVVYRKKSAK